MRFLAAALLICATAAQAQQPSSYEISGQSPLIAGQQVRLFQLSQRMQPLDSVQADAHGRFVLRGVVPATDIYLLSIAGVHQPYPVPLANQARLTAEFGLPVSEGMEPFSLRFSGSAEAALWQRVWRTGYDKLMFSAVPPDSPVLREFEALMRVNASSSLAPYLAYHYLARQASARPLLDSLLTRFTQEQAATPYLARLRELVHPTHTLAIGTLAPDLILSDASGHPVALSSLRGRYVLLDFWASWCKPCRAENPHVLAAYQKYQALAPGFTVYSVSLDSDRAKWVRAVAEDKLPWVQVADLKGGEGPAAQLYQVEAIPATFLLDPQGRILAKDLDGTALSRELSQRLR